MESSRIPLGSAAERQLTEYLVLLGKWNSRMNLTSTMEWNNVGPLFQEGIWAAGLYPAGAVSHLDIGSGAGFPALLLKILNPAIELELIESREKKGHFLATVVHRLGLAGVAVHCTRLSDYLRRCDPARRWDCISWKALKLGADDLLELHARGRQGTQFWMFHGQEPAWEETATVREHFTLVRKEKVPGMREWHLSIYGAV